MNIIDTVINKAKQIGACDKAEEGLTVEGMTELFFSPQGREFCIKNGYPDKAAMNKLKALHMTEYGVFINYGYVVLKAAPQENYAAIGDTELDITCDGTDMTYTIILMHGAKATIRLRNHTVVRIENMEGCEVELDNDGTGIVLW